MAVPDFPHIFAAYFYHGEFAELLFCHIVNWVDKGLLPFTPSVEYSKYVEYSNIKECRKEKPLPTFIENKLMKQTLYGYSVNPLYRYISTVFGKEETERLFALYKVGTSKKWCGSTIF